MTVFAGSSLPSPASSPARRRRRRRRDERALAVAGLGVAAALVGWSRRTRSAARPESAAWASLPSPDLRRRRPPRRRLRRLAVSLSSPRLGRRPESPPALGSSSGGAALGRRLGSAVRPRPSSPYDARRGGFSGAWNSGTATAGAGAPGAVAAVAAAAPRRPARRTRRPSWWSASGGLLRWPACRRRPRRAPPRRRPRRLARPRRGGGLLGGPLRGGLLRRRLASSAGLRTGGPVSSECPLSAARSGGRLLGGPLARRRLLLGRRCVSRRPVVSEVVESSC